MLLEIVMSVAAVIFGYWCYLCGWDSGRLFSRKYQQQLHNDYAELEARAILLCEQRDAANATIDQLKEMLTNEGENNGC